MNARQCAGLKQYIQMWIDEHCDDADWPIVIVGNKTVELMATAARSVFDACEESQDYAIREGYTHVSPKSLGSPTP